MTKPTVFVVHEDPSVTSSLVSILGPEYEVLAAGTMDAAVDRAALKKVKCTVGEIEALGELINTCSLDSDRAGRLIGVIGRAYTKRSMSEIADRLTSIRKILSGMLLVVLFIGCGALLYLQDQRYSRLTEQLVSVREDRGDSGCMSIQNDQDVIGWSDK